MRRVWIMMIAMALQQCLQAKTTYIPTYRNYLNIVNGGDTLEVSNNLDTLQLADLEGMFVLRIDQEDVTKEKVKAIKRQKRTAGWATFGAIMSGVSTAFSDNSLEYFTRSTTTQITSKLADIYSTNARAEQILAIDLWIDNMTDDELMVCDMERGLTWWVLPNQSVKLRLNNPEVAQLRISDPQSQHIRYATVLTGSKVTKWEIEQETDDYLYSPVYKPDVPHESSNLLHYIRIGKRDYSEVKLSKEEYWSIKKSMKK